MAKLGKQMYYTSKEKKINSYKVTIPRDIVKKAKMEDVEEVRIYVEEEGKIIIEKQ